MTDNSTSDVRYLTTREVCDRISVHHQTVRGWLARGEFPNAMQLNRNWRIPLSDVEAFEDRCRAESAAPARRAS